ncbi:hypothetical protein KAR28_06230 [Candidatus Parcubacteria bacterium]|nr:hypothetical protein [Candidatus Parcubacteria bacterium]
MSLSVFATIFVFMGGVILALVAMIYNVLAERIKNITKTHNDLAVNLSSIKTDIKWIKKKLYEV